MPVTTQSATIQNRPSQAIRPSPNHVGTPTYVPAKVPATRPESRRPAGRPPHTHKAIPKSASTGNMPAGKQQIAQADQVHQRNSRHHCQPRDQAHRQSTSRLRRKSQSKLERKWIAERTQSPVHPPASSNESPAFPVRTHQEPETQRIPETAWRLVLSGSAAIQQHRLHSARAGLQGFPCLI